MDIWWWPAASVLGGIVVGYGIRRGAAMFAGDVPVPRGWCAGAGAVGFAVVARHGGPWPSLLAGGVLVSWMLVLGAVDLLVRRLPNALTLPGAAVIVSAAVLAGCGRAAVGGALLLAGAYLVLYLAAPSGMGAGDVKLALGLGAATGVAGASAWLFAALLAPLFTAAIGLARGRTTSPISHGPSMCAATAVALWWL